MADALMVEPADAMSNKTGTPIAQKNHAPSEKRAGVATGTVTNS